LSQSSKCGTITLWICLQTKHKFLNKICDFLYTPVARSTFFKTTLLSYLYEFLESSESKVHWTPLFQEGHVLWGRFLNSCGDTMMFHYLGVPEVLMSVSRVCAEVWILIESCRITGNFLERCGKNYQEV